MPGGGNYSAVSPCVAASGVMGVSRSAPGTSLRRTQDTGRPFVPELYCRENWRAETRKIARYKRASLRTPSAGEDRDVTWGLAREPYWQMCCAHGLKRPRVAAHAEATEPNGIREVVTFIVVEEQILDGVGYTRATEAQKTEHTMVTGRRLPAVSRRTGKRPEEVLLCDGDRL